MLKSLGIILLMLFLTFCSYFYDGKIIEKNVSSDPKYSSLVGQKFQLKTAATLYSYEELGEIRYSILINKYSQISPGQTKLKELPAGSTIVIDDVIYYDNRFGNRTLFFYMNEEIEGKVVSVCISVATSERIKIDEYNDRSIFDETRNAIPLKE